MCHRSYATKEHYGAKPRSTKPIRIQELTLQIIRLRAEICVNWVGMVMFDSVRADTAGIYKEKNLFTIIG